MTSFLHDLDDLDRYFQENYGPSDDEVMDDTLILPSEQRAAWNNEIANLPGDDELPFQAFSEEDQP